MKFKTTSFWLSLNCGCRRSQRFKFDDLHNRPLAKEG